MDSTTPEISLRFSSPGVALGTDAPQCYAYDVDVSILLIEDGEEKQAGTINLSVVSIDKAIRSGFRISEVFESPERIARFFPILFDLNDSGIVLSDRTKQAAGDIDQSGCIMLIHLIDIEQEFAGRRIALHALSGLIDSLNFGCGLIALQACPMQFILNSGFQDQYGLSREQSTEKLKAHYRKAGFSSVGDTDFMVASPFLARSTNLS